MRSATDKNSTHTPPHRKDVVKGGQIKDCVTGSVEPQREQKKSVIRAILWLDVLIELKEKTESDMLTVQIKKIKNKSVCNAPCHSEQNERKSYYHKKMNSICRTGMSTISSISTISSKICGIGVFKICSTTRFN